MFILYDKAVERESSPGGMVHVYTGNGKGKTSAAVGLAFRALGWGKRVFLIQFMKKGKDLGEIKAARRFNKFKILQAGPVRAKISNGAVRKRWTTRDTVCLKDKQLAQDGLGAARKAIRSKKYDLIILDELNVALDFGLLQVQQVKEILKNRPKCVEIVITGRCAHPEILEIADLVSEIRELKHYYKKGIPARAGIEY